MYRTCVILILLVQLTSLMNKSLTVAHFFLHRSEIIEHFCHHATHEEEEDCKGMCYLKAQMSEEDNSPVKNFPVSSLVQDEVFYLECPLVFMLKNLLSEAQKAPNFVVKTPVFRDSYLSIWRPPSVA